MEETLEISHYFSTMQACYSRASGEMYKVLSSLIATSSDDNTPPFNSPKKKGVKLDIMQSGICSPPLKALRKRRNERAVFNIYHNWYRT
jgi:hypothetical protein